MDSQHARKADNDTVLSASQKSSGGHRGGQQRESRELRPGIAGFICTHPEGKKIGALKEVVDLFQEVRACNLSLSLSLFVFFCLS